MTFLYTLRPLPTWPYRPGERRWPRFKSTWTATQELLERETDNLDGSKVVLGLGYREYDVRQDGRLRSDARAPMHPGVELSFDSRYGRLTYATDEYDDWRANARAIALSLEALRAVDRHGVSKRGEQYAGWAQLAAGGPTLEHGRELVASAGGIREALRRHHPDAGGNSIDFASVVLVRDEQRQVGA